MHKSAPPSKEAQALKRARLAKNLTLEELSKLTNGIYSATRINNYEQGIRQIKPRVARDLAAALGNIRTEELLGIEVDHLNNDELEVLRKFRAADERGKAAILAVVKTLAA